MSITIVVPKCFFETNADKMIFDSNERNHFALEYIYLL